MWRFSTKVTMTWYNVILWDAKHIFSMRDVS